jgi:outer membrane protein OmpA-like peptidoglycan-associated protein
MFKDGQALDVVQDGGMANIGLKGGFGNGWAITGGWGGVLFADEPMYESPTWKLFAAITYNKPHTVTEVREIADIPGVEGPGVVAPPGAPIAAPPRYDVEGGGTFDCRKELLMVNFEFDKSTLTPEGIDTLQRVGKYMRLCSQSVLEVQGHTDWMGTENYNIGLGNRRARAVVYYLVYDEGIDPARIVSPEKLAKGIIAGETYGESVPIASNETDSGRALNRRTQFVKLVADSRMLGQ